MTLAIDAGEAIVGRHLRKEGSLTPWSIELRFDPTSEARIATLWRAASEHYATDYVLRHGVIPHVALLVSEETLSRVFQELEPPAMSLRLDGVGFFGEGETAFLHVERDEELIRYHRAAFDRATRYRINIHEYYRPNLWVPHCTIAQFCTKNLGVPPATPGMPSAASPLDVRVRSLILVEYPPTRVVAERQSFEFVDGRKRGAMIEP